MLSFWWAPCSSRTFHSNSLRFCSLDLNLKRGFSAFDYTRFFLAYLRWNTRLLRPHMTQSKGKKEVKTIEPKKIIVTNKKEFQMYSSEVTDLFSRARHVVKSTSIKQGGRSRETQISSPCTRFISLCLLFDFFVFSGPGWGVKHRWSKTKQTKRRKFYNLFPKINYRSFIIQKMRANTVQVLK